MKRSIYVLWDSHSDGYADFCLLWYNAVDCKPPFWRNTSPPFSGLKNKPSRRPAWNRALLATFFVLVSCLACFSTLQMEAKFSSETSVDFQPTTRHCILEDGTIFFNTILSFRWVGSAYRWLRCELHIWSDRLLHYMTLVMGLHTLHLRHTLCGQYYGR
jgi:hypothetical protein